MHLRLSRGTDDVQAPHGIPVDLLDRLLIIRTLPYTLEEINIILSIRAKTEGLGIAEPSVQFLAEIGVKTSLRFVFKCRVCNRDFFLLTMLSLFA